MESKPIQELEGEVASLKDELEKYKKAVADTLHYDMKSILTGTPEERARLRILSLEKALDQAISWLEYEAPRPSHQGSCNPEAGCDGACMDAAYFWETIREFRKLLSKSVNGKVGTIEGLDVKDTKKSRL